MKNLFLSIVALFATASITAQTVTNLNNAGPGSLRNEVLNSQPGDVIDFSPALFANGNATLNLEYAIPILHSLTINGYLNNGDTLIINGQDTSQAFFVDGTAGSLTTELKLSDMVIEDCKKYSSNPLVFNSHGGAIMALDIARLELDDVHFRNNRVSGDGRGGAIYSNGVDSLFIRNCTFVRNRAATYAISNGGGWSGGIRLEAGYLSIDSSLFLGNESGGRGAALSTLDAHDVTISNSSFRNNIAGLDTNSAQVKRGGAILFWLTAEYTLKNCLFEGNYAPESGGAIEKIAGFNPSANFIMEDCIFRNNESGGNAGAVSVTSQPLVQKNCTFESNIAGRRGGALVLFRSSALIERSSFVNDSAADGAAVYLGDSVVNFVNSTFITDRTSNELILFSQFSSDSLYLHNCIFSIANGVDVISGNNAVESLGYNAFSSSPSFAIGSDLTSVTPAMLDLGPLQMNGGSTPTLMPGPNSVALNAGNPNDFSPAQNGPIYGLREIGAAESRVISYDTTLVCGNISWWGNNYSTPGTYSDTAYNANSIDSVGVLVLYSQDTSIVNRNGTLVALEQSQGTSYQWVDCANGFLPVTGAIDSTFLPTANGSYAVVLTNGSCSDTSDCINYNEVGIDEQSTRPLLTFYPNPTNGGLTLNSLDNLPKQLQVLDLYGRTISTLKVPSNEIQLPALSKGIYLLKWEFEGGVVQVDRVVVE
ncbi:right-handed parallel beta-helix repeat-containing protein [Phaeocystidibacter luteus]|uniref:T9SS type A sorting domain-containing protein n=1 Tax=Phaeocystidibacter luteus TaxID=911197 RepID=A0A6N6RDF7_9FLAO|nr:T9SS type A sorting domain-containing protein [Phaeocystidibacter luteus]KAB2807050.1 T9SS type A sorting domain-containing protein [Phaeocystidibacter luteus]